MRYPLSLTFGIRWQNCLVMLLLISHLMVTIGFPLPSPSRKKPTNSAPYPCHNHPCGCLSSEQCWQGDCCCLTLEEKLAWAEANDVEPPEHVRPLIALRRSQSTPPQTTSCCSAGGSNPSTSGSPCCETPAVETCWSPSLACSAKETGECAHTVARSLASCCHSKTQPSNVGDNTVLWLAGIFAQKCRGNAAVGLFQLDPVVLPERVPFQPPKPHPVERLAPSSERMTSRTYCPPIPPPRSA